MKIILDKKKVEYFYYYDKVNSCEVIYIPKYDVDLWKAGNMWYTGEHQLLQDKDYYFFTKPIPPQIYIIYASTPYDNTIPLIKEYLLPKTKIMVHN